MNTHMVGLSSCRKIVSTIGKGNFIWLTIYWRLKTALLLAGCFWLIESLGIESFRSGEDSWVPSKSSGFIWRR